MYTVARYMQVNISVIAQRNLMGIKDGVGGGGGHEYESRPGNDGRGECEVWAITYRVHPNL